MANVITVGHKPDDLRRYLRSLPRHPRHPWFIEEFRVAACPCGSLEFRFHADYQKQICRRSCVKCRAKHWLCDGEQYAKRARRQKWTCVSCGNSVVNVGVRFLLYKDRTAVWYILVGLRCVACGVMACPLSWKAAAGPVERYLDGV